MSISPIETPKSVSKTGEKSDSESNSDSESEDEKKESEDEKEGKKRKESQQKILNNFNEIETITNNYYATEDTDTIYKYSNDIVGKISQTVNLIDKQIKTNEKSVNDIFLISLNRLRFIINEPKSSDLSVETQKTFSDKTKKGIKNI